MIKNSTLVVLLCAVLLGGGVYFYNYRESKEIKPVETPPVFSMPAADVTSFEISHPGKADQPAIRFEKVKDDWQIVAPLQTEADQSSAQGIVDQVSALMSSQSEPGTPDRLKAYGLDPGSVMLMVQGSKGAKHTILMGEKDFTGSSVYSVVDGAKNVSLLPDLLLTSCDKSVDDLRDHTVLHLDTTQVASFALKNGASELAAAKSKSGSSQDQWKFTKPEDAFADPDAIQSLLSAVQNAKFAIVDSEKPDDLAKYGLASPAITFTATDDVGKTSTLIVGKKDGSNYFARDLSRPIVFSIPSDLQTQLTKNLSALRDKKVAHFDSADIIHAEIHNDHGTILLDSKPDSSWQISSAGPQKGKLASSSKVFDPMTALTADEVLDYPPAGITAALAKSGIEIDLTDKNKNHIMIAMSKPAGDVVYARSSDGPAVYKLKKAAYDSLNFDSSQILP